MTKTEILAEIEALASARLFGTGPWLADEETAGLLNQKIQPMGLAEPVPGSADGWRPTMLGKTLDVDLLMAFLGMWGKWDALHALREHEFIDDLEAHYIVNRLMEGGEPEEILKPHVIDAYRRHHGNA